jgi:hypothetical protein
VNPVPEMVAELTVTDAVPVEVSVTDWVAGLFKFTSPKAMLVVLMLSVDTEAVSSMAKVSEALPADAVKVAVCAVETAETVAEKLALVAPAATVRDAGTVTSVLLLDRLTESPPLAAAALRVTVQVSVPAPVMEELVQTSEVITGTPVPVNAIAVEAPVEELLERFSVPVAAPAALGSN